MEMVEGLNADSEDAGSIKWQDGKAQAHALAID